MAEIMNRLRELRHKPDALLHKRRREEALHRLSGPVPKSVLFVCHGNICRSPFAAAAFSKAIPDSLSPTIKVDSVGFIGPGRRPPSAALAAAGRRGIDMNGHKSKVVTAELLRSADLIVVMAPEQAKGIANRLPDDAAPVLVLGDLDPMPITRRTILDPWSKDDAAFDESYDRIERCLNEMVRALSQRNS